MWGDNTNEKKKNTLRIIGGNLNGLSGTSELANQIVNTDKIQSDIDCFQEVGLDLNQHELLRATKKEIQHCSQGGTFSFSTSSRISERKTKHGGTMVHVRRKWVPRIIGKGSEPFGRWSWVTLHGKEESKTTIISAYRVCKATLATAGMETIWMQQYEDLQGKMEHPDPRKLILKDLADEVNRLRRRKHEVIIMMDVNESISTPGENQVKDFLSDAELLDLHQHQHPDLGDTPTHQRGSTRIDYCFATLGIAPLVFKAGILPLDFGIKSDHRTLFIDLDAEKLFKGSFIEPKHHQGRQLVLNNARAVERYEDLVERYESMHKIKFKQFDLELRLYFSHLPQQHQRDLGLRLDRTSIHEEFSTLDNLQKDLWKAAEKRCTRRGLTTTYCWSPKLEKAGRCITFWKAVKRSIIYKSNLSYYHASLQQKLQIDKVPNSLPLVKKELKAAWKHLRKIQKEHRTHREEFLEELARMRAEERNLPLQSMIKSIQNAEESRDMNRKLNYYIPNPKKTSKGSLTSLLIPDGDDEEGPYGKKWTEITEAEDIFYHIIKKNTESLMKSKTSIFAQEPLRSEIGDYGEGKAAESILKGEYDVEPGVLRRPDGEVIYQFIQSLRKDINVKDINTRITHNDVTSIFGRTRESTSSSPKDVHMGHYKVAGRNKSRAGVTASFMSIPFEYGFTLERWTHSIHVMLQKEAKPYVHRCRIVQLFEPDFNAALKILYSDRLMANSEKFQQNHEEIYANRKGLTTQDIHASSQLTFEYSRICRQPMVIMQNDLQGCFDRIRMNLNSIASRRLGMPAQATTSLAMTLRHMKHGVRTAFGDSKAKILPHQDMGGAGQGSGGATTNNHAQLIPMISTLKKLTQGLKMQSPHGITKVHQHVDSWVDDDRNKEEIRVGTSGQEMLRIASHTMHQWRRIVRLTGGDLEMKKCSAYLLHYTFSEGGTETRFTPSQYIKGAIMLPPDIQGESSVKIVRRDYVFAEKYIGVHMAPNGQMQTEYKYRLQQSRDKGDELRKAPLTRKDAILAYQSRVLSIWNFFLPTTYFKEWQCNNIQRSIYTALLPKMGYNRHLPLAVRFGPLEYGGAGYSNMYTLQMIKHLQYASGTLRQDTDLSKMYSIVLSCYQLYLGAPSLFLNLPRTDFPYRLEDHSGKIPFLWKTCNELQATCTIEGVELHQLKREGDLFLMQAFQQQGATDRELKILNSCRLYLQAITLSDIVTPSGRAIEEWAWTPKIGNVPENRSKLFWPHQHPIDTPHWFIWREYLRKVISLRPQRRSLIRPLGRWHTTHHHRRYRYMLQLPSLQLWDTKRALFYTHSAGHMWHRTPGRGTVPSHSLLPAEINISHTCIYVQAELRFTKSINLPPTEQYDRFLHYIASLPKAEKALVQHIDIPDHQALRSISDDIQQQRAMAASDGSVYDEGKQATFGFILHSTRTNLSIKGKGKLPSIWGEYTSQRAEYTGDYALSIFLRGLRLAYPQPSSATLVTHIDNSNVVSNHQTTIPKGLKHYTRGDIDLHLATLHTNGASDLRLQRSWIKGHQDDEEEGILSTEASLNVEADRLAREARSLAVEQAQHFTGSKFSLYIEGDMILPDDIARAVGHKRHGRQLLQYMADKYEWKDHIMDNIDWIPFFRYFRKTSVYKRSTLVKYIHQWQHTGYQKKQFDDTTKEATCKLCGGLETQSHYLWCSHREWKATRKEAAKAVSLKLRSIQTNPTIISIIARVLECDDTHDGIEWNDDSTTSPFIQHALDAAKDQAEIGWTHVLMGRVSKKWRTAQHSYILTTTLAYSDDKHAISKHMHLWSTSFIATLIQYGLGLWDRRNNKIHGATELEHRSIRRRRAVQQVLELFERYMENELVVGQAQQAYFHKPAALRIEEPTASLELWIKAVERAMERKKTKDGREGPKQRTLDEFFLR